MCCYDYVPWAWFCDQVFHLPLLFGGKRIGPRCVTSWQIDEDGSVSFRDMTACTTKESVLGRPPFRPGLLYDGYDGFSPVHLCWHSNLVIETIPSLFLNCNAYCESAVASNTCWNVNSHIFVCAVAFFGEQPGKPEFCQNWTTLNGTRLQSHNIES